MRNYLTSGLLLILCVLAAKSLQAQGEEFGIASYYADEFQGRSTASGELYDMKKFTAAHKSLSFGTVIRVTRLDNKKFVDVRINDRGPYIKGRIVDISKAAAQKLDLITDGKAEVKISVINKAADQPISEAAIPQPSAPATPPSTSSSDLNDLRVKTPEPKKEATVPEKRPEEYGTRSVELPKQPAIVKESAKATKKAPKTNVKPTTAAVTTAPSAPAPTAVTTTTAKRVRGKDFQLYDLYKIQLLRPERAGFGVQVASLSQYEYVMKQVAELQENWFNNILVSVEKGSEGKPMYKIILGPFADRTTAESYKRELKKNKKIEGFVVELAEN